MRLAESGILSLSNEPHGKGVMKYSDGSKYRGNWKDGERHGQGTIIYPDGKKWVGRFKDGKPRVDEWLEGTGKGKY